MICSFIIPTYNASKTIVRCLDSIYSLLLDETAFEVICIDDCSVDSTIDVIKQYAQQYDNLTLLCQTENHRQGAARNRGVALAKGKYVIFVDSDDESDKGVVEALRLAEEHRLDMVAMHYVHIDQQGCIRAKEPIGVESIFTGVELQTKQPYWCSAPWAYVYNLHFLKESNYPFVEDVLYEDSDFVAVHLYYAKRMMYSSESGYKVYFNSTSTTHTISYKHIADYLLLGTRMLKFYDTSLDSSSNFAKIILEGGSYNISKSCSRLIKLSSVQDVKNFYERVDLYANRTKIYDFRNKIYYWNWWITLVIKHKHLTILLASLGVVAYKFRNFVKNICISRT